MSLKTNLAVRLARDADLDAISKLSEQLGYPVTLSDLKRRFQELGSLSDHQIWVAVNQNRVVGFQHARVIFDLIEEHGVEIAALVVDEGARSLGVGSMLVSTAEKWAKELQMPILFLRSNVKRDRAHRFYLREGFSEEIVSVAFTKKLV